VDQRHAFTALATGKQPGSRSGRSGEQKNVLPPAETNPISPRAGFIQKPTFEKTGFEIPVFPKKKTRLKPVFKFLQKKYN
jgi:hypothetical protein